MNYLREHVIYKARIHSVVTSGGQAPNVVPAFAQVWYFVRAPHRRQVDEIYARVLEIAHGSALMSGTRHEIEFITGGYDLLPNNTLSALLLETMQAADGMRFHANAGPGGRHSLPAVAGSTQRPAARRQLRCGCNPAHIPNVCGAAH